MYWMRITKLSQRMLIDCDSFNLVTCGCVITFISKKRALESVREESEASGIVDFDEFDPRRCLELGCTFVNRSKILSYQVVHCLPYPHLVGMRLT